MSVNLKYTPNKTTQFFSKLSRVAYVLGNPNLWIDHVNDSKLYNRFRDLVKIILYIFIATEVGSYLTQRNLTEKQASDQLVYAFSHPILAYNYVLVEKHKLALREIFYKLAIDMKKVYNDLDIEQQMIRKATLNSAAHACCVYAALVSYGFDGLMQAIRSEGTFTTVVTVWPDVTDTSVAAEVVRVINYILWWIFVVRAAAVYSLVICISVALSHQYKNLYSYFCSLNNIFDDETTDEGLSHEVKERKYEESLKIGFKMHADILSCINQCQEVCNVVFSGQIVINVSVLCLLMLQMMNSERTLSNAFALGSTAVAILIGSGFLMWNAGDITVEAATIPTALFMSGWQNCRGRCSYRVRSMVMIAMVQAEKPVIMTALGIIDISYQAYLSIVKSSYSAFSLFY